MEIVEHFGPSIPLREVLARLGELPEQWLHIPLGLSVVDTSTPCTPRTTDSRHMSEEESDALDSALSSFGLQLFLTPSDLVQIAENLRQQCSSYSPDQLIAAVNHYWTHDAFIEVTR
jgi:hypothetical protein